MQFALVSDQPGQALIQDPHLVNPWGIGLNANAGEFSIADTAAGVNTFYGGDVGGSPLTQDPVVVSVPGGSPTGQIFNTTTDFSVNGGPATFLFAGAGGDVSGWNSGTTAQLAASVQNADFTGLTTALGSQNELYATDFRNGKIDVFDPSFNRVIPSGTFSDPNVPAGMAPFNIINLNGELFVTYAPANDTAGSGFLAVFDANGNLITDMPGAAATNLNVPWGLAIAPSDFGGLGGDLLVANAGNGQIEAFNMQTLNFLGTVLNANGNPLTIDGLKAIAFGNGLSAGDNTALFFTAGTGNHQHGLFGSIVSVDGNPLEAVGDHFSFTVGSQFNGVVATLADSNLSDQVGAFTASINWGDGSTSAGNVISLGAGRFDVSGSHTYSSSGKFNVAVTIGDVQNDTTVATSVAQGVLGSGASISMTGVNPSVFEGQSFSGAVATFTDSDGNTSAAAYSATVHWGDGATSQGSVALGNAGFGVSATHTYTKAGSFTITVVVTDTDGDSATVTGTATVAGSQGTLTAQGTNLHATEAGAFNGLVATFTDSDGNTSTAAYSATINWGDGVTSSGTVTAGSGDFDVSGTHTYGQAGTFTITAAVTDTDGDSATANGTATVAGAGGALTAQGANLHVTEASAFNGLVATFTDSDGNPSAAAYGASINWGDGVTSPGTVTAGGSGFGVSGSHIYGQAGTFTIIAVVTDTDGDSATAAGTATVAGPHGALAAQGINLNLTEGSAFNGMVASFTDADGNPSAAAYSATVNWGDGVTSSGTVTADGSGFDVSGTHTYGQAGSFTIIAVVTDTDGDSATAAGTATVAGSNGALTAQGVNVNATEAGAFSGAVAKFTDADGNTSVAAYSASINWGDGAATSGTVTAGVTGFDVTGTHTYSKAGSFTITSVITDTDGQSATAVGTATVSGSNGALTAQGVNVNVAKASAFDGVVATFSDSDGNTSAGAYSATVHWGDGATTSGTVTAGGAGFDVVGIHTYADMGSFPLTIVVNDVDGDSAIITSIATVSGGTVPKTTISAQGANLNVTEGSAFNGLVASFTDADGNTSAAAYSATIDWGDGVTTPGTLAADGTGFEVSGTHSYAEAGSFAISVVVSDTDGAAATTTANAAVAGAPVPNGALTTHGVSLSAIEGGVFSGVVATFDDSDPSAAAGDFTARILWGDGGTTTGTISSNAGAFQVAGQHIYAVDGTLRLAVMIQRNETDATVTAMGTASIANVGAPIAAANALFVAAAYLDVLGRSVDASGQAYWDQLLDGGEPRAAVVNALDHSAEYFANHVVAPAYQQWLARTPDPVGLAYWIDQLQNGLSDERFEADILATPEFAQRAGGGNQGFVDALYENLLGRPADSQGQSYWTAQLAQGAQRSAVALNFAMSAEHERLQISDDYLQFLGRLPDDQGSSYFLNFLAQGGGNEAVIAALAASDEFFARQAE